jgi:sugar transferase (PEP-CTERM/EpsH1 system associated)
MKVLMLCGEIPFPPHGGSRMRVYQFLRALAGRHAITLLAYSHTDDDCASTEALKQWCRVQAVRWQEPEPLARMRSDSPLAAWLAYWRALLLDTDPFVAQYFRTAAMTKLVRDLLARDAFDLIHVEDTAMMALLPEQVRAPIVLSIENVEYWREARAKPAGVAQKIELAKVRRFERRAFQRAAVNGPTSHLEAGYIEKLYPKARVRVIANGVDTLSFTPAESKATHPTLVFSGTLSYAPNADGVQWFVSEVFPIIRGRLPAVCLQIVGREPSDAIRALADEHVSIAGDVPDVRPYLRSAWVSVVPIREGGGTRLKILEAMACALPVVSTTVGAEGLAVTHGQEILIADDVQSFSQQVIRLLCDASLQRALGSAGRALVEKEYDWRSITDTLEQVYLSAAGKPAE